MIPPRRLFFTGSIEASGLWLDRTVLDEAEIRRRVLACWRAGSSVARAPGGVFVRWPSKKRLRVDQSPGAPLIERDGVFYAAPLTEDELAEIGLLPGGTIVRITGGVTQLLFPRDLTVIDPSEWLDTSSFSVIVPRGIGPEARYASLAIEPLPASLRQRLPGVPAEDPAVKEVLAALRANEVAPASSSSSWWVRVKATVRDFVESAREAFRAGQGRSRQDAAPAPQNAAAARPRRGLLERLFTKFLVLSRLSRLIGERHARYLSRMMSMFERGDLKDALRHAIPLDSGESITPASPALSTPKPRSDLQISTSGASSPARSLFLHSDLFEELRRLYRAAFDRLVRENRLEEAAFVLAELLGESEEAVNFLEKHDKKRLAAELAEARKLPPGLIVRQWFIVGDVERALRVARRYDAYADALVRLARTDAHAANRLRVLWASELADAGDFLKAIEVIHPVRDTHLLRKTWLDRAIAVGGVPGARALGMKVVRCPEPEDEILPAAMLLLSADGREAAQEREAFARGMGSDVNELVRNLARPLFRARLRDRGLGFNLLDSVAFGGLSGLAEDRALYADLPYLPQPERKIGTVLELRFDPADRGTLVIHDLALLPGGKILLALGEAGVRLVSRDGRAVAHFDVPAFSLVVSDHGTRALAIAPRGSIKRIAKIDLIAKRSLDWVDARIDVWARTFDGGSWFVADGETVQMIDVLAKRFEALWRVSEVGGPVHAISRSPRTLAFVVDVTRAVMIEEKPLLLVMPAERWLYDLPSLTLRSRLELPRNLREVGLSPEGRVIGDSGAHSLQTVAEGGWPALTILSDPSPDPRKLELSSAWLSVALSGEKSVEVSLFEGTAAKRVAKIVLAGAKTSAVSFFGHEVAIADSSGRVLRLSLDPPVILADQRQ